MKLKQQLIHREIAGDHVLIPVGQLAQSHPGLFAVNEQAAFLWDNLAEAEDENQLLQLLLETYEVDEATAKQDLDAFLGKLRELEIL